MIYVAAPYSDSDKAVIEERMTLFAKYFSTMIANKLYPVSPLLNHYIYKEAAAEWPTNWEFWEGYSRELLTRCTSMIVLMIDGWKESEGVQAEIQLATELGIPIEYCSKLTIKEL